MRKAIPASLGIASFVVFGAMAEAATIDLITNGDFEAGDTGFSSDYLYKPGPNANTGDAQYTVDTDPQAWNTNFFSYGDKTSGAGNMMIVNGATTVGVTVWSQTVAVNANTDYTFGTWIADAFGGGSGISLDINGTNLGSITASTTQAVWEEHTFDWNSGTATEATISLLQGTTQFFGNDYTLDDISFTTEMTTPPPIIPLPASAWLLGAGLVGMWGLRKRRKA